jgi:hypothetical protein
MARTPTRRSSRKAPRRPRRAFDPRRLPYAEEAQTVTDIFNFLTGRLPAMILEEFERLDLARNESELFRALASLPDATLRRAGLRRAELPRYVLSVFHVVDAGRGRRGMAGRKRAVGKRTRKAVAKRGTKRGAKTKAGGRRGSATRR